MLEKRPQAVSKDDLMKSIWPDVAIEEGNQLASDLVGEEISKIGTMVTAANGRMAARQKQLDDDTANGSKPGVQYGDVILDTAIT